MHRSRRDSSRHHPFSSSTPPALRPDSSNEKAIQTSWTNTLSRRRIPHCTLCGEARHSFLACPRNMATDEIPLEVRTPWNPPPSCQCRSIKTTTVATAEEGLYIETVEKFICVLHRPAPEDLPLPTESFLADLHSSTPPSSASLPPPPPPTASTPPPSSASPPPPPPPSASTPPSSASPQPPSHTGWKKYRRSDEEAKEEYDKVLRERNLSGRTLTINGGELCQRRKCPGGPQCTSKRRRTRACWRS